MHQIEKRITTKCINKCKLDNEKYKALLKENNQFLENTIKESKQEMELTSKLLFEALPLIKNQLRYDEYSSLDFNAIKGSNNSIKKREALQKILESILNSKKESGFTDTKSSNNIRY